jgi:hypothetical protein
VLIAKCLAKRKKQAGHPGGCFLSNAHLAGTREAPAFPPEPSGKIWSGKSCPSNPSLAAAAWVCPKAKAVGNFYFDIKNPTFSSKPYVVIIGRAADKKEFKVVDSPALF